MSSKINRKIVKIFPLKRSSEFLALSKSGNKLRPVKWLTVITGESENSETFFGTTVSRKVGSAIVRNKLKRWVRHCVRSGLWPKKLIGKKCVFIFRPQPEDFYKKLEFKEFKTILENI